MRPRNALADAFIRKREERISAAVVKLGDIYRSADVESELVSSQKILCAATLPDLMPHRIQGVISKILVEAPVPGGANPPICAFFWGTVGTDPEIAGLHLEFLNGAVNFARGGGCPLLRDEAEGYGYQAEKQR